MPLVCDIPGGLHADAPAFLAEDGAVGVPKCPLCGERHRRVPARDGRWGRESLAQSALIYAGMVLADGLCAEARAAEYGYLRLTVGSEPGFPGF